MKEGERIALLAVALVCSCTSMYTHVRLPLGYHHVGVKHVVIRSADSNNYLDLLAEKEIRDHIVRYPKLFKVVARLEDSDMDLVVSGREGFSTRTKGFGFQLSGSPFSAEVSKSRVIEDPTTHVEITLFERDAGLIYQKTVRYPGAPHSRMASAANRALRDYIRGR